MKRPRIGFSLPELWNRLSSWFSNTVRPLIGRFFSLKPFIWMRHSSIESALIACGIISAALSVFMFVEPMVQRQQQDNTMQTIRTAITERVSASNVNSSNADYTPLIIPVSIGEDSELDVYGDEYDYVDSVPMRDILTLHRLQDSVEGIGILSIEKIGLELPVIRGATKQGLKAALGHVSGTADIGSIGNAVIAGHRSYTYGRFFNRLDEVEICDTILYTSCTGELLTYTVYDIEEVEPSDPSVFNELPGESKLTLLTCTPVRVASHRLLVKARLVSDAELTAVNSVEQASYPIP